MSKGKLTNLKVPLKKYFEAREKTNPRFAAWIDEYKNKNKPTKKEIT